MDTDVLRELLMLEEKRSYAAAADALFISASTLSRHIAALENQMGVTLFHRNSRSVMTTPHGELLISYARKIIETEDECQEQMQKAKRKLGAGIRIGTGFDLSSYGLMSPIASFLRENIEIAVSAQREDEQLLPDMIRSGKYDFAFLQETAPSAGDEFSRMTVAIDQLAAVLPRNHLLAEAPSLRLTQLQKEDFLLQPAQTAAYRLTADSFRLAGYTPSRVQLEAEGVSLMELVEQGLGVALKLEHTANAAAVSNVAVVPLDPPERIWINLIWEPENITAAGKLFISHLREYAQKKQ